MIVHEPEMRKGSTIPMAQISNITNISQMTWTYHFNFKSVSHNQL